MGFYLLDTSDPEDIKDVDKAYCKVAEIHLSLTSKSVAVVLQCWRSFEAAFESNDKKPFKTVSVTFGPISGGSEWIDGCHNYKSIEEMTDALEHFILTHAPSGLKLEAFDA